MENSFFFILCLFLNFPYFLLGESIPKKCHVFPKTIEKDNVFVQGNVLTFDKKKSIYKATGKVHLIQRKGGVEKHLFADDVIYNKVIDKAIATGNVLFKDGLNNTAHFDYLELSDDFKNGFAKTIHIITNKNERFLGDHGIKSDRNFTHFFDASYTPCLVADKKDASWQLNAKEAVHDKDDLVIRYYHMTFSIYGFPIFYSPYFSHADPKVKRKAGLLMPAFQQTERDGGTIIPSIYFPIDKYSDLTLSPIIMRYTNPILAGIYRKNIYNGEITLNFSAQNNKFGFEKIHDERLGSNPNDSNHQRKVYLIENLKKSVANRWHLFFDLAKNINENQRFKINIARASDTGYTSDYPRLLNSTLSDDNKVLASKFLYEFFSVKSYTALKSFLYQSNSPEMTPFVFPAVFHQTFMDKKVFEGSSNFTFYTDFISRNQDKMGVNSRKLMRFYSNYQWSRDWVLKSSLFEINLDLFCRGYLVDGYRKLKNNKNSNQESLNFKKVLFLPMTKISWSYPLLSIGKKMSYMIEPKASLIMSPFQKNDMPNNDSRTVSLDDSTIFMVNRFDGYDRYDSGIRFVYGLFQKVYFSGTSRYASWFIGHSRRLDNKNILGNVNLGEDKKQSDVVSYIKIVPLEILKFRYRNAINLKTKKERFREVGLSIGKPLLSLNASYINLKHHSFLDQRLSQINWMITSEISSNWSLSHGEVRDLSGKEKGILNRFSTISWKNDCATVKFLVFSTNYKKSDVEKNKGFSLTVEFKFLGDYTFWPSPYEYIDTGLSHF